MRVWEIENDDLVSWYFHLSILCHRWYHGRISRQTACERLELVGEAGGYLVRESVGQPGDYAISYLSCTGQVHHFKINSNCGCYFIGGRKFLSLNDLIGFYANCSCILKNESLEVPIVPPKVISTWGEATVITSWHINLLQYPRYKRPNQNGNLQCVVVSQQSDN